MCDAPSEGLKLGELLHQLLHAVLLKLYCNLRVVPFAFAPKYGADAVFRVSDARALFQAGLAGGLGNIEPRPASRSSSAGHLLSAGGEEARDVVHGVRGGDAARGLSEALIGV